MKSWVKPQWFRDPMGSMKFFKGGDIEEAMLMTEIEADIVIPWREYMMLKHWMVDNDVDGTIKTDRKEDLKIIHRTLDIVQSLASKVKEE